MVVGLFRARRPRPSAAASVHCAPPPPPPPDTTVLSYEAAFRKLEQSYEADEAEMLERALPRDALWYVENPLHAEQRSKAARISGRQRLTRLHHTLDSFGYERWEEQRAFHRAMEGSIMAHLFRDDLDENIDALLREYRVDRFCSEVLIISQRRKGKTFAVAMFAAACMLALEAVNSSFVQCIFSTCRRASHKLLQEIFRLLCRVPGGAASIITHNMEHLVVQGQYGINDLRELFSYPSKAKISVEARPLARSRHLRRFTDSGERRPRASAIVIVHGNALNRVDDARAAVAHHVGASFERMPSSLVKVFGRPPGSRRDNGTHKAKGEKNQQHNCKPVGATTAVSSRLNVTSDGVCRATNNDDQGHDTNDMGKRWTHRTDNACCLEPFKYHQTLPTPSLAQ